MQQPQMAPQGAGYSPDPNGMSNYSPEQLQAYYAMYQQYYQYYAQAYGTASTPEQQQAAMVQIQQAMLQQAGGAGMGGPSMGMSGAGMGSGGQPPNGVCRDYLRGACARATCKYAHSGAPTGAGMGMPMGGGGMGMEGGVCHDYLKGQCMRGAMCKYQHQQSMGQSQVELCRDFQAGKCQRPNCKYHHQTEATTGAVALGVIRCRDFASGLCNREHCKYLHASDPQGGAAATGFSGEEGNY